MPYRKPRKRRFVFRFGFLGTLGVLLVFIFAATPFFSRPLRFIANYVLLEPVGWHMEGDVARPLVDGVISLTDFQLRSLEKDQPLFQADSISLRLAPLSLFRDYLQILELSLNNPLLNLNQKPAMTGAQSSLPQLHVNHFDLGGGVVISGRDTVKLSSGAGELWLLGAYWRAEIDSLVISPGNQSVPIIKVAFLAERKSLSKIALKNGRIDFNNNQLSFSASIDTNLLIKANVASDDFSLKRIHGLASRWPEFLPMEQEQFNLEISGIPGETWKMEGHGYLYLARRRLRLSKLQAKLDSSGITLEVKLHRKQQRLQLTAILKNNAPWTALVKLHQFDPDLWYRRTLPTPWRLSGLLNLTGEEEGFRLEGRLRNVTAAGKHLDRVMLAGQYITGGFKLDSLVAFYRQTRGKLTGNLTTDKLALTGEANIVGSDFKNLLGAVGLPTGDLITTFQVEGQLKLLKASGRIKMDQFGTDPALILSGNGSWNFERQPTRWSANLHLQGTGGKFLADSPAAFDFHLSYWSDQGLKDTIFIYSPRNRLETATELSPAGFKAGYFTLAKGPDTLVFNSLRIDRDSSRGDWLLRTVVGRLNETPLYFSGEVAPGKYWALSGEYPKLNLAELKRFLGWKLRMGGIVEGRSNLQGPWSSPAGVFSWRWLNTSFLSWDADSALTSFTVGPDSLLFQPIVMYRKGGVFTMMGTLPFGWKRRPRFDRQGSQDLQMQFEHYPIRAIGIQELAGKPVAGRVTGLLNWQGTPFHSTFQGSLQVTEARFDTLHFNAISAITFYHNDSLWLDTVSFLADWGFGGGHGLLPARLDLAPDSRPFLSDDSLNLYLRAELNSLQPLSSYLGFLDAMEGNFTLTGSFRGPMKAPRRDFQVRGHNATAYLSFLGNPVTNIHTELNMVNNQLLVKHFTGELTPQATRLPAEGAVPRLTGWVSKILGVNTGGGNDGQLSIAGQGDFTDFFHPRLALEIKGKNIYYLAPNGALETAGDLTLSVQGQDTIDIIGEMTANSAFYQQDFLTSSTTTNETGPGGGTVVRYNLHTSFPGKLRIENDLLQADFEGELWIMDYGDGRTRLSGTLTAVPGGKIYYLGNELEIVSGTIQFDPVDFNPKLEVQTRTVIAGDDVELGLSGRLNDLQLVVPANSRLSQSDILAWLNVKQKLEQEGFDPTRIIDPVQSYVGTLVEKQIEKYGRKIIGLDILDVRTAGGNQLFPTAADSLNKASILLGQRLSRNLKVTYEGPLQFIEGGAQYRFGIEYQFNKYLSITGKVDQEGLIQLRGRLRYNY